MSGWRGILKLLESPGDEYGPCESLLEGDQGHPPFGLSVDIHCSVIFQGMVFVLFVF